ncbi:sugar transferase [Curtobacterium sp. Leaf183]|uniref:sugar transferase n=1 Tax=Curtobacterium sp. Leaf183 TaxID=1736291 RepID=UPI000A793E9A|nr:sugar transferase [Curtobacterium sp. Leaf183]
MALALRPARSGPVASTPSGPSRHHSVSPRRQAVATAVLDLLLLVVAFAVAHVVRFPGELRPASGSFSAGLVEFLTAPVVIVLWMVLLSAFRTRDPRIRSAGCDEYRRLLTASLLTGGVVAVAAYALDVALARGYVAIAFPLGLLLLALGRKAVRTLSARRRSLGRDLADVLLVGDAEDIRYVGRRIIASPTTGYRVVATVTDCVRPGTTLRIDDDVLPVLGGTDQVLDAVRSSGVAAVVVAGAVAGGRERLRRLGWELEELGVELVVSSPIADIDAARVHHRPVDGLPLMHIETPDYGRRTGKRALDVVGAALGLVLLAPVFAVVALLIRHEDGGPVFFRQTRVGRGGEAFSIVKFRTMCTDAEARVAELAEHNEGAGPLFKMKQDPRVTRVGAVLRTTSLDELPQLWNVLVGTMSLVGPRPALPREVALYADFDDRRLLVTPGITGLWQVSGRSDLDWADGVRLDQHYVENWSFLHDVVILARTIPSVLRSRGAY